MRTTLLALVLIGTLAACGDEAPVPTIEDDETTTTPTTKEPEPQKPPMTAEQMAKVAERLKRSMEKGNRTPGMPNESLSGDPRSAVEAARRLATSNLGVFSEDEARQFLAITKDLEGAKSDADRAGVFEKHGMTAMRFRMVESLFKRADGIGPKLTDAQRKLVDPWMDAWRTAAPKK